MPSTHSIAAIAILAVAAVALVSGQSQNPFPPSMRINKNTVTVSGISAGAAMSIQVEFAFASLVRANGIVAGVPYSCSQGEMAGAFMCMDDPETISVSELMGEAQLASSLGINDPWQDILNHTITMFSGTIDTVVAHGTMLLVDQQYATLGQSASMRVGFFNYTAEHAWITNAYGNSCSYLGSPYVNNCGLDFAGVMLKRNFDALGVKWNPTPGKFNASHMHAFDQYKYGASSQYSLDSEGYIYVPEQCRSGAVECHLHMNFHGCEQYRSMLGRLYVDYTGLNEWAEANNIVVVYPQATASDLFPENPKGCFDWWGYAGSGFANKNGPQMVFVANMFQALTGVKLR